MNLRQLFEDKQYYTRFIMQLRGRFASQERAPGTHQTTRNDDGITLVTVSGSQNSVQLVFNNRHYSVLNLLYHAELHIAAWCSGKDRHFY
jgi:hypothetical protein